MLSRQQSRFSYLFLPEMKFFWLFFGCLVLLLAAGIFLLPEDLFFLEITILFIAVVAVILIFSFRSARLNLVKEIEGTQFSNIISNLYDAVIAYDPDFKILVFNKAAEKIFNIPASEVIGKYFTPEKAKDSRFAFLCQVLFPSLAPLVVRGVEEITGFQVSDFSFDDPKFELRIATSKIVDSKGNILGFLKVIRDRTRELAILKSKSEFIEIAAHQLRTPLTGILWGWESLAKENLTENQMEIVKLSLAATRIAVETVNDLLDVAKIEDGRFDFHFEEIELLSFIEEIVGTMAELASQAKVKLFFQRPKESEIRLIADKHKLSIAVSNLLTNAIKYNVINGQVIVSLSKISGQPFVQICVKDTGIGIPSEGAKRLFTKFYRAENAIKAATEGIGLGLYITKNIIKAHGGDIWVESELNRGSAFYFTLPTDQRLIPSRVTAITEEY